MLVRPFRLSDYSAIASLFHDVLSEACCEETMAAFARQLALDPDLVLVADVDKELTGVIFGTIDQRNRGYYYRVAVAESYQRKGIGKSLIAGLKQKFTQRKVSKILVTVDAHNEPVIPVYKAVGYTDIDFSRSFHHLRIVSNR
ncbi:MAG: family acetyltransferase [Paenibacillus sp.]|nr:family acetyltransferase [Paenibacillus sp.]